MTTSTKITENEDLVKVSVDISGIPESETDATAFLLEKGKVLGVKELPSVGELKTTREKHAYFLSFSLSLPLPLRFPLLFSLSLSLSLSLSPSLPHHEDRGDQCRLTEKMEPMEKERRFKNIIVLKYLRTGLE